MMFSGHTKIVQKLLVLESTNIIFRQPAKMLLAAMAKYFGLLAHVWKCRFSFARL
jgi:hypothetical protein